MALGVARALPPLFLEDADLRSAALAFDDRDDARIRDEGRAGEDFAGVGLDQQDLLESQLLALVPDSPVDGHEASRRDFRLMSAVLDDCVHVRHLCKRGTVQPKSLRCKGLTAAAESDRRRSRAI